MAWRNLLFYFPALKISVKYKSKVLFSQQGESLFNNLASPSCGIIASYCLLSYKYEHNNNLGRRCLNRMDGVKSVTLERVQSNIKHSYVEEQNYRKYRKPVNLEKWVLL